MKNKLLFLFILMFAISAKMTSQDTASLKAEALKTYEASAEMDFNAIFETTYPKVFDIVSRDQMKEMFSQMLNNENFTIKMTRIEPNFKFGQIKKIGSQFFCVIEHDNAMAMTFKTPMDTPESLIETFKASMNAKEVTYDKTSNTFHFKLRSTMIAIADESTKNKWKFLNNDKKGQLFTMIFNENIKKELGL